MTTSSTAALDTDVVIIGGGLAGLTTAMGLLDSGLRTTVLERDTRLGGRARTWTDEQTGDPVDIGPHILLQSLYPNLMRLLEQLGTADQVMWEPERFITLADGPVRFDLDMKSWPPPLHLLPWLAAHPHLGPRDHLSNVRVTLYAMQLDERDIAALDDINAYAFLRRMGVTRLYIEKFWSFICLAIMNVPIELCSAGALLRFYQVLIGCNSYRSGFARAGLGNLFAPGAARQLEAAGHSVRCSTSVEAVRVDGDRAIGLELDDGRLLRARFVVSTVPPQALRRLLPRAWLERHQGFAELGAFQACPYISSYLWFDRKITDLRFWARVDDATGLNTDFYDLTNIDPERLERPSIIASNIIYAHRVSEWTDEEILAATLREIRAFIPGAAEAEVSHHVINRLPMGIPCPYPGMERRRLPTVTPIDGLILAGDWTQTHLPWSMESAVRSGWLAAERVLDDIARPASLAIHLNKTQGLVRLVQQCAQARPSKLFARAHAAWSRGRPS